MAATIGFTNLELQTALRIGGLPPAPNSPFAGWQPPATIDPVVMQSLRAKSVVNGDNRLVKDWHTALSTLASPTQQTTVYAASADRWFQAAFYSSSAAMVGWTVLDDGGNITAPATAADLQQFLGGWLCWNAVPPAKPFEAALSADELTLFVALVDACREENLRAFLERRTPQSGRFAREQLVYELEQAASGDPRWLASILHKHAPPGFEPGEQRLNEGAAALAGRGLVSFADDLIVASPDFLNTCQDLANVVPYVALQIDALRAPSKSLIIMTGLRSFAAIDFPRDPRGAPLARLRFLGGADLAATVDRFCSGLPKAPVAPPAWDAPVSLPPGTPPPLRQAPAAVPPTASAPPPLNPPPPVYAPPPQATPPRATQPPRAAPSPAAAAGCRTCGLPLKSGKAFCGGCGTKTT